MIDRPSRAPEEIQALTADAIERADRRIADGLAVAMAGGTPTFAAVFEPLDDAARIVMDAFGQGGNLREVAPEPEVRQAAAAAVDAIEGWRASLPQRPDIVEAVAAVAASVDATSLDPDRASLLRHWQSDIRLAGGGLDDTSRAEINQLLGKLIELQGRFIMNLGNVRHLELTRDELAGVPDSFVDRLQPGETPGTLDVPMTDSMTAAILESAMNRGVRERAVDVQLNAGMPDNRSILEEAVTVRRRLAALLGEPSWLAVRAPSFAAKTPETILAFLDEMEAKLRPLADAERARMRDALAAEPGAPPDLVVEDWDWRHADTLQRRAAGVSPEELRAYLPFEAVFEGLRRLSEDVFGVRLEAHPERTGWHPDVRAFDMVDRDSGAVLAHLFVDPYARPGKQPGAWAGAMDAGDPASGRPRTIILATNAPSPADGPSLLGSVEVDALFHEYGHALDFGLEQSPFVLHRSEAWSPMDWVEGPSQFLGRWGAHPKVLATYARHHETGAPVPDSLLRALEALEPLNAATRSLRHLSMGRLDVLLHGEAVVGLDEANERSWAVRGTPFVEGSFFPASFIHLLAGYEGALYGFVWSQVLRDDLMSRFEREGMLSPLAGAAYRRHVLEWPWSRDPLEGLAAFLGRPWSSEAFLARVETAARD
ncbi:MAG TPA: M3 family metallopeptidase [Candidatus Limnocylindrales bacterium]